LRIRGQSRERPSTATVARCSDDAACSRLDSAAPLVLSTSTDPPFPRPSLTVYTHHPHTHTPSTNEVVDPMTTRMLCKPGTLPYPPIHVRIHQPPRTLQSGTHTQGCCRVRSPLRCLSPSPYGEPGFALHRRLPASMHLTLLLTIDQAACSVNVLMLSRHVHYHSVHEAYMPILWP